MNTYHHTPAKTRSAFHPNRASTVAAEGVVEVVHQPIGLHSSQNIRCAPLVNNSLRRVITNHYDLIAGIAREGNALPVRHSGA
jgi:hypothetical protein